MQAILSDKPVIILSALCLISLISLVRIGNHSWEQWSHFQQLDARMDTLRGADTLLMNQTLRLKQLALAAKHMGSNQPNVDSHLAFGSYLDSICDLHEITIVALPQEQSEQVGMYAVSSERFRISGGFHDLLHVLYTLEYKDQIGSLSYTSLQTQTLRHGRNKQTILLAEVELKRLEKK